MGDATSETTFLENPFGTVTSKRVVYFRKKGWFSGGSREDVPLKHVTSVRVETSRKIFVAIVLIVLGIVLLPFIVGIVPIVFGILHLVGSPSVVVATAGGGQEAMTGWPWHRELAEEFAKALRAQLFKD